MANVVVVGAGNVGSGFLAFLAKTDETRDLLSRVFVLSRSDATARAAIQDATSAFPGVASKYSVASRTTLEEADYIIFSVGHLQQSGETPIDHFETNKSLAHNLFYNQHLKPSAVIIMVSSPVDRLTPTIHEIVGLPYRQVLGFGGDLDYNRLKSAMAARGMSDQPIAIVGEHGPKSIPVIEDEAEYHILADEVRTHLAGIARAAGQPRNLATGALLVRLLHSIVSDSQKIHFVCGYHPRFSSYITWPFVIGRMGTGAAKHICLGPNASSDLEKLLSERNCV